MNMIDFNDPKLTAYALGELESSESALIEAHLAESAALRAAVDEIRHTAQLLSAEFAAEPMLRLTDAQRQAIQSPPQSAATSASVFRSPRAWVGAGLAAAACLTVAVILSLVARHNGRGEYAKLQTGRNAEKEHYTNGAPASAGSKDALKDSSRSSEGQGMVPPVPGPMQQVSPTIPSAATGAPNPDSQLESSHDGFDRLASAGAAGSNQPAPGQEPLGKEAERSRQHRSVAPSAHAQPASPPPPGRMGGSVAARAPVSPPADKKSDPAPASIPAPGLVDAPHPAGGMVADNDEGADAEKAELNRIVENEFVSPLENPLATFSIDVDTASYSNIRQYLSSGQMPPKSLVRIEEMINYFPYNYDPPSGDQPFSATVEVNDAPWNVSHRLLRIGLKGREVKPDMRSATSLVFLLDVSGSMGDKNKLPLVKESMKLLVQKLNADDRLAIVTYAGETQRLLESMYCTIDNKPKILSAIESLHSGGSTNGASGIGLAYQEAAANFIKGGVNRVILCTDGDFNVGVSSDEALIELIEKQRTTGVFLSVMGFGTGDFKDQKMEQLADHGNGNYAYIDTIEEAKKVLVDQMGGTLETIAKDVKIQVDFNPVKVGKYRLIGYENRVMAARDFANDKKDAGEIGAGHTVTALFEIIPADGKIDLAGVPASDFIEAGKIIPSDLLLKLKIRYKEPAGDDSKLLEFPMKDVPLGSENASPDFQFAAAVASFGMILRDSPHKGSAKWQDVIQWASAGRGPDEKGYRREFIQLVEQAREMR